jgi:hypothetical protein
MRLNQYAAETRLRILSELKDGKSPSVGEFDPHVLSEGRVKGQPQLGTTRFEPDAIYVEFIYPDPLTNATVLTVKLTPPERIVYLPVPSWVIETIWQGEISGSYEFESDARRLVAEFSEQTQPGKNEELFSSRMATGRS